MTKLFIDSKELNGVELGRAYIMLGSSYHVEGKLSEAQDAFERSIRILEREPEQKGNYASALEDYGGFYSDMGQLLNRASDSPRQVAERIGRTSDDNSVSDSHRHEGRAQAILR